MADTVEFLKQGPRRLTVLWFRRVSQDRVWGGERGGWGGVTSPKAQWAVCFCVFLLCSYRLIPPQACLCRDDSSDIQTSSKLVNGTTRYKPRPGPGGTRCQDKLLGTLFSILTLYLIRTHQMLFLPRVNSVVNNNIGETVDSVSSAVIPR